MEGWGLTNGRLEPWAFGHPGWANELAWGAITAPVKDTLVLEVLAWTPGTKGAVKGTAVNIVIPEQPTPEELAAYFAGVKDRVKGAVVLVGLPRAVPVNITPPAKRRADEDVKAQYDPDSPTYGRGRGGQRGGGRGQQAAKPGAIPARELGRRIDEFLVENGALARMNDAGREHGQIIAFSNNTYDITKAVPTVVVRNEDYGRIARILADGTPVEIELNIVNKVYPEGRTAYNAIAEIPGSDKADEVVMLGGHLDSWHSATGATDNAIGCAIMMEAARIVKTLGVAPRRTIRVALWSGEEEGLLGSLAYVKEHFGSFEAQKPEWSKLVAYLNVDTGTGRLRGASVFGPRAAADTMREILAPFQDLGIYGAAPSTSRTVGGTDSTSFNNAGLPGIGFQQDPNRVQLPHPSHEPRHLRAGHRGRREEGGGDRRVGDLSPVDAGRDAAAVRAGRHAAGTGTARAIGTGSGAVSRGYGVIGGSIPATIHTETRSNGGFKKTRNSVPPLLRCSVSRTPSLAPRTPLPPARQVALVPPPVPTKLDGARYGPDNRDLRSFH